MRISDIPSTWETVRGTGQSMLAYFLALTLFGLWFAGAPPSGKSTVNESASGESLVNEVIGLCLSSGKVFDLIKCYCTPPPEE